MIKEADSLQAVLFTYPGAQQSDALQLWSRLFPSDSPDGFQRTPPSPNMTSNASGDRGDHTVVINAQVGRINITLMPGQAVMQAAGAEAPPRLNDVSRLTQVLREYSLRLATGMNPVRAAIVLDLAQTIPEGGEAAFFARELPHLQLPVGASEPSHRFNVRTESTTAPPLPINRILNWITGGVSFATVSPTMLLPQPMVMSPFGGLNIDVNTAPEIIIPPGMFETILSYLTTEALAIYEAPSERFSYAGG